MTLLQVATDPMLRINEVFGPTLQGEGPAAGRSAMFVRLAGCNLSCSWCDTGYTWDSDRFDLRQETTYAPVKDLTEMLRPHQQAILVITGGEPLLQQDTPAFRLLLDVVHHWGMPIHVETNGTIPPSEHSRSRVTQWCVSPKLPNAGMHRGHQSPALNREWLRCTADSRVALKFVCRDGQDVDRAVNWAVIGWMYPRRSVWVMPEGVTAAELADRWPVIAARAAYHGINASHRLHVLAWGSERGH